MQFSTEIQVSALQGQEQQAKLIISHINKSQANLGSLGYVFA